MDRDQIAEPPQAMDHTETQPYASAKSEEWDESDGFIPLELLRRIARGEAPWPVRQG
jgi:hypothetical protein